jgi:uncharacterized OsmC-like protein
VSDITGEMELEDGVLVLKRIHANYKLRAGEVHRQTIQRVHDYHRDRCPVARSLAAAIAISTSFELVRE